MARRLLPSWKIVWYRTWTLDQGDARACFASAEELAVMVGYSVKPASIETIRQLLKRLGLHTPLTVPGQRHLSWVAVLPAEYRARFSKESATQAARLDEHLSQHASWREAKRELDSRTPVPVTMKEGQNPGSTDSVGSQNPHSTSVATAPSRGVGGLPSQTFSETEVPSRLEKGEKGIARAIDAEKRGNPGKLTDMVADVMSDIERKRREA